MNKFKFSRYRLAGSISIAMAAGTLLFGCSQQTPPEICADFNAVIDRNIMEIALSDIDGDVSDKSAMQQGARLARSGNRLSTIMLNVQLQAQNKCPPRQKPLDPALYSEQATACYSARLEQMTASYGSDEGKKAAAKAKANSSCDFKTWNTPAPR